MLIGFGGTVLVVRPGLDSFNLGSVFIIISVLFYAGAILLTRPLQRTDSSATMAYYSSLVYLVATAILAPTVILIGDLPNAHPSVAFLFHDWSLPTLRDAVVMSGLGLTWAGGMFVVARAYSSTPASVIAPFEYVALPINVAWGFVLWHDWPTLSTWAGAALTILCGLAIITMDRKPATPPT